MQLLAPLAAAPQAEKSRISPLRVPGSLPVAFPLLVAFPEQKFRCERVAVTEILAVATNEVEQTLGTQPRREQSIGTLEQMAGALVQSEL